jgi:hypothetical protein
MEEEKGTGKTILDRNNYYPLLKEKKWEQSREGKEQ